MQIEIATLWHHEPGGSTLSLTFDMASAGDCLQDFRDKINQFEKEGLNTSLAMECAVAGWSVLDWIFNCDGQRLGYTRLKDLQDDIKRQCQSISLLRDIANARKHKKIDRYTPLVKSAEKHDGAFSRAFCRDFDIPRLVVHTDSGKFDFWTTLQSALAYYEGYFKQNNIS